MFLKCYSAVIFHVLEFDFCILLWFFCLEHLKGRVRILALIVKLFSISSSVASEVLKSNLLNLLEAEVRNTNDTLVTLSVLELIYEVGPNHLWILVSLFLVVLLPNGNSLLEYVFGLISLCWVCKICIFHFFCSNMVFVPSIRKNVTSVLLDYPLLLISMEKLIVVGLPYTASPIFDQ